MREIMLLVVFLITDVSYLILSSKSRNSKAKIFLTFKIMCVANLLEIMYYVSNYLFNASNNVSSFIFTSFFTQVSIISVFIIILQYIFGDKIRIKYAYLFYIIPCIFLLQYYSFINTFLSFEALTLINRLILSIFLILSFAFFIINSLRYIYTFNAYNAIFLSFLTYIILIVPFNTLEMFYTHALIGQMFITLFAIVTYETLVINVNINSMHININTALDQISSAIILINADGKVLEYNHQYVNLYKSYIKNNENILNFFFFIDNTLSNTALTELKSTLKNLKALNETTTFKNRFLHNKVYKTFNFEVTRGEDDNYIIILAESNSSAAEIKAEIESEKNLSKFEALGKISDGVISDINKPISAIKTNLSILKTDKDINSEDLEFIELIDSSASKINILTTSMKNHFRSSTNYNEESFDLSDLIISIETLTKNDFKNANCKLVLNIPDSLIIYGIPSKISQVLINILNNSLEAYKNKNAIDNNKNINIITIDVSVRNKKITLKISDFAGGIKKDLQPYIFNSILTTKGSNGFGLGLYVSSNIIKDDFNGKISYTTKENVGTTLKIVIPVTGK